MDNYWKFSDNLSTVHEEIRRNQVFVKNLVSVSAVKNYGW